MSNPVALDTPLMLKDVRSFRDAILTLADKHGATEVRIFGSVARGDATPESDLDLLVRWDYGRVSAWGGVGFDLELQNLLGVRIDVISEEGLSTLLRARILKEAVPL